MSRKPSIMYREMKKQANTRKKYMGGVPNSRIIQFDMGNRKGVFPMTIGIQALEKCQIRHNALEAARIAANKYLSKKIGTVGYHLKIKIYPHNVLRENKTATGAGADRVSEGMRRSFGKPVSTAARVKNDQTIITVSTTKQHFETAKTALRKATMKLPTPCKIIIVEDKA